MQWDQINYGLTFTTTVLEKYGITDQTETFSFHVAHSYAYRADTTTAYLRPDGSVILRHNQSLWACFATFATWMDFRDWCDKPRDVGGVKQFEM